MNREGIVAFLKALKAKNIDSSGQWISASCLLARWRHDHGTDSKPSFGIRVDPEGRSRVFCFACQFSGGMDDLVIEFVASHREGCIDRPPVLGDQYDLKIALQLAVGDAQSSDGAEPTGFGVQGSYGFQFESYSALHDIQIVPFPEKMLTHFKPVSEYGAGAEYLKSRDVSPQLTKLLDLRFDGTPDEMRVCFPIRDFDGVLVGLHGRTIKSDIQPTYRMYTYKKQKNPHVWYGEDTVTWQKPVVIVESVFDRASVLRLYKNVICPLTAAVSEWKIARLKYMKQAITIMDWGKAGKLLRAKLVKNLPGVEWHHIELTEEQKDPGNLSVEDLEEMLAGLEYDPLIND